jgi:hypothetical protein
MWNDIETFLGEFYEKRKKEVNEDVQKMRDFYERNKAIIFWIIVCIVSLEYLDYGTIMHGIGRYNQIGGVNNVPAPKSEAPTAIAEPEKPLLYTKKQFEKSVDKARTDYAKEKGRKLKSIAKKYTKAEYFSKKSAGLKKTLSGPSSFGFLKKKAGQTGQAGQAASAAMGPLSTIADFFSPITNMISKGFYIISIILTIIGFISLPILLIMILTYFTIKYMASKIMEL